MLLEELMRQMQTGQIAVPGNADPSRMSAGGPAAQPKLENMNFMPGPSSPTPAPSAPPQSSGFSPNPLSSLARGYQSGGLVGALGNMMEEPQRVAQAQAADQKKIAEANAIKNQTAQFLRNRIPGMSLEDATLAASNPAVLQPLLKQLLAPQDPNADLDRRKTEAEIKKLEQEAAGGGKSAQRLADLDKLGIDPDSAEGVIYQANGKLPESASKEIIGRQQKAKAGPQVARGLENLRKMAEDYDQTSLESAIGPWQGADPDQTGLLTAPVANIARGLGEVWNTVAGGKNNLSEIRSNIRGTTEALAAAIKPLIRGPGEGVWTDADQARLVAVVGDLSQASTKDELMRRLNAVRDRIQSNFNIEVPFEAIPEQATGSADDYSKMSTDDLLKRARGQK